MAVTKKDIVRLPISKTEVLTCIKKAQQKHFIDNLRNRHPNVKFDSVLRGEVGELAFEKWLNIFAIKPEYKNRFDEKRKIDIDLALKAKSQLFKCELKTSLIPDQDKNIGTSIIHRDIKLIKRKGASIEQLHGDIHIQLYFNQLAEAKDNWLKTRKVKLESEDLEYIYFQLGAYRFLRDIYFVGWIDKPSLLAYHTPKEKTWSFKKSMRTFYRCNLHLHAKKPFELIAFFKSGS